MIYTTTIKILSDEPNANVLETVDLETLAREANSGASICIEQTTRIATDKEINETGDFFTA